MGKEEELCGSAFLKAPGSAAEYSLNLVSDSVPEAIPNSGRIQENLAPELKIPQHIKAFCPY